MVKGMDPSMPELNPPCHAEAMLSSQSSTRNEPQTKIVTVNHMMKLNHTIPQPSQGITQKETKFMINCPKRMNVEQNSERADFSLLKTRMWPTDDRYKARASADIMVK